MIYAQDPTKHLGYLQQCLSSDKRPLGLFLGAGCPMAIRTGANGDLPLIPGIDGITNAVRDTLAGSEEFHPLLQILDHQFEKDGRGRGNVEQLLSHIRALRSVAGKDSVRGLTGLDLDKLDDKICQIIHELADRTLPDSETPYHFLASWAGGTRREYPVEVFTTNYDLLMEQAFEDRRVPYFDGFAGARRPFFDIQSIEEDKLPVRWARLWKVHGSINWYQLPAKGVVRGEADKGGLKRVIHPSHLKYEESRRMPYLAMMDRLKAFLKQPGAALVLCGYSFRDEHINEVLLQGLQSAPTGVAFALLFGALAGFPQASTLGRQRSNLSILAKDGGILSATDTTWPETDAGTLSPVADPWVAWTALATTDGPKKMRAEFRLGDFAVFGRFLSDLVGAQRGVPEAANAK
jgi:hypothetical protein